MPCVIPGDVPPPDCRHLHRLHRGAHAGEVAPHRRRHLRQRRQESAEVEAPLRLRLGLSKGELRLALSQLPGGRRRAGAPQGSDKQTKGGFKLKALLCPFHNQTLMKPGWCFQARVKLDVVPTEVPVESRSASLSSL